MSNFKQLIQIAKKQLNMDDAVYRANLRAWTHTATRKGKSSTAHMTVTELKKCYQGMCKLGFKPRPAARKAIPQDVLDQFPLLKKLGQIWTQMHKQKLIEKGSYLALEKWAVKQSKELNAGKGIEKFEWMNPIAGPLIEQLKQYHRRLMLQALTVKISCVEHYLKQIDLSALSDDERAQLAQKDMMVFDSIVSSDPDTWAYHRTLDVFEACQFIIQRYGKSAQTQTV